jgi:hypothetical protein
MIVAAACLAVTGCGASHPNPKTIEGPVTTVNQHTVCVGGLNASGECFTVDSVTRSPDDEATPSTATRVEHLDAATNASTCPHQ